ncbi:MAG: nuclease A inhibitor family protein [Cyanobacteria bacterium J06623_7]
MGSQNDSSLDKVPDREFLQKLQTATRDLLWYSEAESPWEIFYWHDVNLFDKSVLLQRKTNRPTTEVAIQHPGVFFAPATQVESWHNELEIAEVRRYQNLRDLLLNNLTDTQVYLVGTVEIDTYILGTTEHQAIAGIMTKIIRT